MLVASTGIMGSRPPVEPFERGVPLACRRASRDGRTRESTARWKVISMTVEMVEIFLQILILLAFGFLFSKRDIITDSMKTACRPCS